MLRCLRVDCVEHQCPMMTDRDIAQMLTRVPWEEMGTGEGGHTYDAQQLCKKQEVGKMHSFK